MTSAAILWIDGQAAHAAQARQLIAAREPDWRLVHSPTVEAGSGAFTSHTWDAVVLTGSTPILPEGLLRQVAPRGRLFAVIGDLPVMKARLLRRDAGESITTRDLFETVLDPLKHAAAPARFQF